MRQGMPQTDAISHFWITEQTVRRQGVWGQYRPELTERLSHLVECIMRGVYCDANAELRGLCFLIHYFFSEFHNALIKTLDGARFLAYFFHTSLSAARSCGPLGLCASPPKLCANPLLAGRIFLLRIADEHQILASFLEKRHNVAATVAEYCSADYRYCW